MRRRLALLSLAPLLLVAACGGSSSAPGAQTSSSDSSSLERISVAGEVGSEPDVTVDGSLQLDETDSEVVSEGDGDPVVRGKQALLNLYVANGRTGKKAASTYDQGRPANLQMSKDRLFPAVLDAVVDQPAGSRVVVAATPEDAYGDTGASQIGIKPDDDVVFVVDIMAVEPTKVLDGPKGEKLDPPEALPKVREKDDGTVTRLSFAKAAKKPGDKLRVVPLVQGSGPKVRDDSLVTFDYLGQVYGKKKVFDESYSKDPVTFPVGVGGLIPAWDKGLVGVRRGSRVLLIVPPSQGYGKSGNPQAGIKGSDTLAFVIDILGAG